MLCRSTSRYRRAFGPPSSASSTRPCATSWRTRWTPGSRWRQTDSGLSGHSPSVIFILMASLFHLTSANFYLITVPSKWFCLGFLHFFACYVLPLSDQAPLPLSHFLFCSVPFSSIGCKSEVVEPIVYFCLNEVTIQILRVIFFFVLGEQIWIKVCIERNSLNWYKLA